MASSKAFTSVSPLLLPMHGQAVQPLVEPLGWVMPSRQARLVLHQCQHCKENCEILVQRVALGVLPLQVYDFKYHACGTKGLWPGSVSSHRHGSPSSGEPVHVKQGMPAQAHNECPLDCMDTTQAYAEYTQMPALNTWRHIMKVPMTSGPSLFC